MRYNDRMAPRESARKGLTVAITGPTGEIGQAVVASLERSREVASIVGMARRPFDPSARGWKKVSYRQGDVLDRDAVRELVRDADVVVHLAFMIMGGAKESREVNLVGSRNVFEASVSAGAKRLVYASSVAAYGFHRENPQPLTEEVPARGTAAHYYSAQKAEVEALLAATLAGADTAGYVFRPCIVAGAAGAAADRQPALHADLRAAARDRSSACSTACRSSSRCCPTPACPSSWCTTTTWPARCARRRSAAEPPACTTSREPAS